MGWRDMGGAIGSGGGVCVGFAAVGGGRFGSSSSSRRVGCTGRVRGGGMVLAGGCEGRSRTGGATGLGCGAGLTTRGGGINGEGVTGAAGFGKVRAGGPLTRGVTGATGSDNCLGAIFGGAMGAGFGLATGAGLAAAAGRGFGTVTALGFGGSGLAAGTGAVGSAGGNGLGGSTWGLGGSGFGGGNRVTTTGGLGFWIGAGVCASQPRPCQARAWSRAEMSRTTSKRPSMEDDSSGGICRTGSVSEWLSREFIFRNILPEFMRSGIDLTVTKCPGRSALLMAWEPNGGSVLFRAVRQNFQW